MKKTIMIMGLALCSTLAMAQTVNRTPLAGVKPAKAMEAAKAPTDYKASIFTKADDTIRIFHFNAADMATEGMVYGDDAVLTANDQVNGTAIGAALAHAQTRQSCTWNYIADSADIYTAAFRQVFTSPYVQRVMQVNADVLGGSYTENNGFMFMSMVEVGTAAGAINAYIQLPPVSRGDRTIDVIDVNFLQLYMCFNADHNYIDYKLNGAWKSREINVRGVDVTTNNWATVRPNYTMPFELADATGDIELRIRWASNNAGGGGYGYFWMVDEFAIVAGDADRMKRYSQTFADGGYGMVPQSMKIPLSWYASVANNGRNTVDGADINLHHGMADDRSTNAIIGTYPQDKVFAAGDPTRQYHVMINERHFIDSLESVTRNANGNLVYDAFSFGTEASLYGTSNVPASYNGIPVEETGFQYVQMSLSKDTEIDTIYWPYRTYTVTDATNGETNGEVYGYRWAHDNGIITNRNGYHDGLSYTQDEGLYRLSDTNHYQQQGFFMALRYTTGSEIPLDDNGEPWVFLGLEIVPSTDSTDLANMNNSEFYPLTYKAVFNGGNLASISDIDNGTSTTRPYVVSVANDANTEEILNSNEEGYKAATIKFPGQPELEPNTTYYLGYQMANTGFFCPTTTATSYFNESTRQRVYLSDNADGLGLYTAYFAPEGEDIIMYDPASGLGGFYPHMGYGGDGEFPMIRAIVGPRLPLEKFEIQATCAGTDSTLYNYAIAGSNGQFEDICDLPSGSLTYNEGSAVTVYLLPSDDEHYVIDSIIINGTAYDPMDNTSWPEDLFIEAREAHVMNPADTNQIALWRYYYAISFEELSEDKNISAVAHWEPWHIGIDPVAANVALGVQPNPATSQVKVNVAGVTGMVNCSIIDMSGRVVYNKDIDAEQPVVIDLSNFARGAYFVRVTNDTFSKIEKLIVR